MKVLITGGAGFIGSAVIRHIINNTNDSVINVDKLTYAGHLGSLTNVQTNQRYHFAQVDICDAVQLNQVFNTYRPDAVMHLAAESHVDRSIDGPSDFINTNIVGTYNLLEVSRHYWSSLSEKEKTRFRFHHISTDEVYGDLAQSNTRFTEHTAYAPSSPYAASKASSDHLVRAWFRTFDLPIVITNCSNNYGPNQFPEKLIPLMILNALEGKPLPIYGHGEQVRDWLYVEDHAKALYAVLTQGKTGETYNIGGDCEKKNIDVVTTLCELLEQLVPQNPNSLASDPQRGFKSLITFVADRQGHDLRYAVDSSKIKSELNWSPKETFESGIGKTVKWYLDNIDWINDIHNGTNHIKFNNT